MPPPGVSFSAALIYLEDVEKGAVDYPEFEKFCGIK